MLTELKRSVQSFYDSTARQYVERDAGPMRLFHNCSELSWLAELDLAGKQILDIGAGAGRLSGCVSDIGVRFLVAADLSHEMLRVAHSRASEDLDTAFVQCDAEHLPFPGNMFHCVVCLGLFEYVVNLEPFLREFFRVTVPEGYVLFTCRNANWMLAESNRRYPVARKSTESVLSTVRKCGYILVRHATIYHFDGRGIARLSRLLEFVNGDVAVVRAALALNQVLRSSGSFRDRGKTHLVLARRT